MEQPEQHRLLVLDDDPTGSQCVGEVDANFDQDPAVISRALHSPGSICFTLTNSRSLEETDAVVKNQQTVRSVIDSLLQEPEHYSVADLRLHLVSRSDSTLRGHVIAEPNALADVLAEYGISTDAFLFCPAMIEAGRFTEGDIHYALVDGQTFPVSETDFARDATFGYHHAELPQFLEEKSKGAVSAAEVLTLSLDDIRTGGPERVREALAQATDRQWVVVNAKDYADMEVVATAVAQLEARGRTFISRCGPSFVRALAGQQQAHVLQDSDIAVDSRRKPHGLVVVGSHVGLTTRQLEEVQSRGGLQEHELSVEKLLRPEERDSHLQETVEALASSLEHSDTVVFTSRERISTSDPEESLAIARKVSDALVEVVRRVRQAQPAWVIAKGGITSHEIAEKGLDIKLARVRGQFYPGQISLFEPTVAPEDVRGLPYVVFPGNVGGANALADVAERLNAAVHTAQENS